MNHNDSEDVIDEPSLLLNDTIAEHIREMTSILVLGFNKAWSDDEKCQHLAEYMVSEMKVLKSCGLLQMAHYLWHALEDVIIEYGEPIDDQYCGRDEEGEKTYHTFNPETNWNARVNKVLYPLMKEAGLE
jgi:hypothetical protein